MPKSAETNHNIESVEAEGEPSDKHLEKPEQSRSSWIGSTVNGWLSGGEGSNEEPRDEDAVQESFKRRKLAIDENQLKEEKTLGWFGDELTNVLGFGQKAVNEETKDSSAETTEDIQPSSWFGLGIKDVLGFRGGESPEKSVPEDKAEGKEEPSRGTEELEGDKNQPKQRETPEASDLIEEDVDHGATGAKSEKEHSGWYGRVYNGFTGFYGDKSEDGKKADGPEVPQPTPDTGGQDESIFSVNHFSVVFDGIKSSFQSGVAENGGSEEEKPPEETVAGKTASEERLIDEDNERNDDDEINPIEAEEITEMQSLSDETLTSSEELQEDPESEEAEEKPTDDVILSQVEAESSKDQPEQSQADLDKKDTGTSGEIVSKGSNLDDTNGAVDSKQPESLIEKTDLHQKPTDLDTLDMASEVNAELDHVQPDLSTDQGEDVPSVLNSDEAEKLSEGSRRIGSAESHNLDTFLENISFRSVISRINTDSETKTVVGTNMDTAEAQQLDNLRSKEAVVAVSTTSENQKYANDPKTDGFPATSETVSATVGNKDQNSLDVNEEILLEPEANEFGSYPESTTNATEEDTAFNMLGMAERDQEPFDKPNKSQLLEESVLGSGLKQAEFAREEETLDVSEKEQGSSDVAQSLDRAETEGERKRENDPGDSKQEHGTSEKIADATLSQTESEPRETQEKIPLKQHPSDLSSAKEEHDHVTLVKDASLDHTAINISLDSTEDTTTSYKSDFPQKGSEHKEFIKSASEDANVLDGDHGDHASLANDASADHSSQGSTEDLAEKSNFLSENEDQKGSEHEESLQKSSEDANKLDGEHSDHVSLAKVVHIDNTTTDISLDSTENTTTPEENGILSKNEKQKRVEHKELLQKASEGANTLDRDHVLLAKDATGHKAFDISQGSPEDTSRSEENGMISETEKQKVVGHEETIHASKEAKMHDRKHGDHVSVAEGANTDHTGRDISLDSTEDITTSEKRDFLSENEQETRLKNHEESVQNASDTANMLDGEHNDHAKDTNTDYTALDMTLDSTEDTAASEEHDFLSENEKQLSFEHEESVQNASEDVNKRQDSDRVTLAEDATDQTATDISLDSTEVTATSEKRDFLSEKEHNKLDGEHSDDVSLVKDTDTSSDISQDGSGDPKTSPENGFLSENDLQKEFKLQNDSEDAKILESDEAEQKSEPSRSRMESVEERSVSQIEDENAATEKEDKTSQRLAGTHFIPAPAEEPPITTSKEYSNLQAHLSEENIKRLMEVFDGHELSRLDQKLGPSQGVTIGQDDEDLSVLSDFARTLEYQMEIRSRNEDDARLLAKVDVLLSALREGVMPVVGDGSVDKGPGTNHALADSSALPVKSLGTPQIQFLQ